MTSTEILTAHASKLTGNRWWLSGSSLVNALGNGLFMVAGPLYFVRIVGIGSTELAEALTISALLSVAIAGNMGRVVDRAAPAKVYAAALALQGAVVVFYLFVDSFVTLLIATFAFTVTNGLGQSALGVLSARIVGDGPPAVIRSRLRAVTNGGLAAGSVLAGVAVQADNQASYSWALLGDAASFLLASLMVLRVSTAKIPAESRNRGTRGVLRDRRYVAVTGFCALTALMYPTLSLAVPLWIAQRTTAPRWMISFVFLTNTLMVVFLQVAVGRRIPDSRTAARSLLMVTFLVPAAFLLFSFAQARGPVTACMLLGSGALLLTTAELLHTSAAFLLSYQLADTSRLGEYQGFFGATIGLAVSAGPALAVMLPLLFGVSGWTALAVVIALSSTAAGRVARVPVDRIA